MSTTVTYKGNTIATVNNNTKTLETEGTWLEADIVLTDVTSGGGSTLGTKSITANGTYNASSDGYDGYSSVEVNVPGGGITPTGTKQISITANGTTTEDVTNYANAEITVNVSGGGTSTFDSYLQGGDVEIVSNATSLKAGALCSDNITKINLPECISLGLYSIAAAVTAINGGRGYFTKLSELKLPKVASIDHGSISYIGSSSPLKSIVLPSLSSVSTISSTSQLFVKNAVEYYDLGNSSITSFGLGNGKPFYQNGNIKAIILRYGGVVTIGNTTFYNTNTANIDLGNTAFIYVPSSLLENYKTANNWATLYASYPNMFKTIEGSIYETQYADGTPISS